jgi:hypothetical protein
MAQRPSGVQVWSATASNAGTSARGVPTRLSGAPHSAHRALGVTASSMAPQFESDRLLMRVRHIVGPQARIEGSGFRGDTAWLDGHDRNACRLEVTNPMSTGAEEIIARARHLSEAERRRFKLWRDQPRPTDTTLWSQRATAIRTIEEKARTAGREQKQVTAMDRAFQAVAASAGDAAGISFFADDRGPEPDWEAAGRTAAEAVAAWVASDLISDELFAFIIEPWNALLEESSDSAPTKA